jgi:hypothetical protein
MNFSKSSSDDLKYEVRRQSILTLAFFCFFILLSATSCSDNIFRTPHGNRSLEVDTLYYDHQDIISGIKNRNINASGNQLLQNKVGHYRDLSAEFIIKFSNFIPLTGLPDSVELTINQASALFYLADYRGDESTFSMDISMVDNDTSLYWLNSSVPADVFSSLEGHTTPYSTVSFPVTSDSIFIPLDLDLVNDWHTRYDSLYVNNGFTVNKSDDSEGMIAFHSADYISTDSDMRPRLVLECSLHDTNGVFLQDSVFYLAASADLQHTESTADIDDSLFYMARGNIFRAYLMMDSLRNDSLLGPTRLLNRALQTFVIDKDNSMIADGDTLYVTARLFKADHWETDSISYMYTAQSDIFTLADDSIRIDISQLVQYLVSNPKQREYEGIFYYLQNEYNAFNSITIDPSLSGLDIIYTKVRDE